MLNMKTKPMPESWAPSTDHHDPPPDPSILEADFRPQPPARADTMHSRYVQMLLEQDHIPKLHNILASFFVWLLLASFIVFPGTFTTIRESIEDKNGDNWHDKTAEKIFKSVKNIPLLVVAAIMCSISAIGMTALAWRHMTNFVWLLNKLFLPGIANCLAGLISTLVGVYSQQHGIWSATAKVTAIVEGVGLAICAGVFLFVDRYFLDKVKENHGTHYDGWTPKCGSEVELGRRTNF